MRAATLGVPASPTKRLGGYLLDVVYSTAAMFVLSVIASPVDEYRIAVSLLLMAYVLLGVYFWSRGTSPGKMTLGVYVHDATTGERLGFWKMLVRETVGKWLSGFIFGLGYLWILLDDRNQAWHDKLVNSVVVEG